MKLFCHSVDKWLKQNPKNVVAVHCKGGKGRTGVMCSAWLLYSGLADKTPITTYQDAANYFQQKRTLDQSKAIQGVTGLSQMEALRLFDNVLKAGLVPSCPLRVQKAVVTGVPFGKKGNEKTVTPYLRLSTMAGVELWMGPAQPQIKHDNAHTHKSSLTTHAPRMTPGEEAVEMTFQIGASNTAPLRARQLSAFGLHTASGVKNKEKANARSFAAQHRSFLSQQSFASKKSKSEVAMNEHYHMMLP